MMTTGETKLATEGGEDDSPKTKSGSPHQQTKTMNNFVSNMFDEPASPASPGDKREGTMSNFVD
eukprot:gene14551-1450_t